MSAPTATRPPLWMLTICGHGKPLDETCLACAMMWRIEQRKDAATEEMRQALEEIKQATQRHPLLVGFVHHAPTVRELQDRLDTIAGIVDGVLNNDR